MSVSAKLYCKKSKVKPDGTAPIYIVLRINSKPKLILTGKYIDPNLFDNNTGKAKRGFPDMLKLNAYLGAKLAQMEKVILDFQHQGRAITHEYIISAYNADGSVLFVDFSRKELEDAKGTIGKNYYDTIGYQLEKLDKFHPSLTFKQLDYNFLQKYAYYLASKGNKPNTMKSDFVMIRKFLNLAIKKGLTKNYPFDDFDIPSEESIKEYLTLKEVEGLHNVYDSETLSPKLQNTLFYFLLACYTGLRMSDVRRLSSMYLKGSVGNFYISMVMKKTRKLVEIPLSNRVVRLLTKRVNVAYTPQHLQGIELLSNENLFSYKLKQSKSRINNDVREVISKVGINKYISFHCSRHSFAINSLILGISLEVISNILGHTQLKTTQIYAKIVNELKVKQMEKWNYD